MSDITLPPYNESVVIKVLAPEGHIHYRVETRDRPKWQREFRTLVFDKHDFLLDRRHELKVLAWAPIPKPESDVWRSPINERPNFYERVLCLVVAKTNLLYPSVRHRSPEQGDGFEFCINSFDHRVAKWLPIHALHFTEIDSIL